MSGLMYARTQSDVPYYIKEIGKNIYSIEELSYYLYNHLYLVDEDFFTEELIDYIEDYLNYPMVSNGLKQAVEHNATLSELVSYVVKASGYYNAEEIRAFQRQLDLLRTSSVAERQKAKADILMTHKKYIMAMEIYNKIIQHPDSNINPTFYGDVINNIAVIYVNMYAFEDARRMFSKAYKINHSIATLRYLIYCEILCGTDMESIAEKYSVSPQTLDQCITDIAKVTSEGGYPYDKGLSLEKCIDSFRIEYEHQMLK